MSSAVPGRSVSAPPAPATSRYLDRYGWDIAEDEASWQENQRRRMAEEYADDEW